MNKIQIKNGQNIWFTSDTHYNHKNLCKGVTEWDKSRKGNIRNFEDLDEMNSELVFNINSKVKEGDILFHFGDWSFGGIEQIWEFRKRINCQNIYLFFGNHDHHIINNKVLPNVWSNHEERLIDGKNPNTYGDNRDLMFGVEAQSLFTWCGYYGEFELIFPQAKKGFKKNKFKFIGMHYPIASWNKLGQGVIHLHGHLHLNKNQKIHQGRSMDVGVDGNLYKPYNISDIQNIMLGKQSRFTKLKSDHHSIIQNFFRIFK